MSRTIDRPWRSLVTLVDRGIVPLVNRFRSLQDARGRIVDGDSEAVDLLRRIVKDVVIVCRATAQDDFAASFADDVGRWLARGLDCRPDFPQTRGSYRVGENGTPTFFIAPTRVTNGPDPAGYRMECHLALVDEPAPARGLLESLPPSVIRSRFARYVTGSAGFAHGYCLVNFSEQIAACTSDERQYFSVFLLNRFHRIFNRETMPAVRRLLGRWDTLFPGARWLSAQLDPAANYWARCIWAAAHEAVHQAGPRPLHAHLHLKRNWFCGVLEELKVDASVVLMAHRDALPQGREIIEFILLDRMFRYPNHPSALTNFDAGTGVFLFEWLVTRKALQRTRLRLRLELASCAEAMAELVARVTEIERHPDEKYLSEAMVLVRSILPEGPADARYIFPGRFAEWVGHHPARNLLSFRHLPF